MLEIKFIGRGGQGVVVASRILGLAFFKDGWYPQCYSVFGGERRGAPLVSFLRVDHDRIRLKCEIKNPGELICLDEGLLDPDEIRSNLRPGGAILINTPRGPEAFAALADYRLGLVDGLGVAREAGLERIFNTALCGAYAAFSGQLGPGAVLDAVRETAPVKVEENVKAASLAYERVVVFDSGGADA